MRSLLTEIAHRAVKGRNHLRIRIHCYSQPNFCSAALSRRGHMGETMAADSELLAEVPEGLEKRMWQAVIVTAIQEWISGPLRSKRQAEQYLFQDQKDFPLVCQSAGMDADRLRAKLKRLRLQRAES